MELHPILEHNITPNPGLWYVLSAFGDCPSVRVGHTCTYIPSSDGTRGKVYVIGGANPSGSFGETFVLDLSTFSWDVFEAPGLKPRYEHSAFVPQCHPNKVYIFGGADQSGNHNDIQVLDTIAKTWTTITPIGTPPSSRTYHTTVCAGDKFVVYSGGHSGSDPVGDRQVHIFDCASHTWSTLNVRGDSPKPRHGHLVMAIDPNKILIHGGMAGTAFYDDLHVLDLNRGVWKNVKSKKVLPCARAAHSGAVINGQLYVFGGMNREGALDDMYKLDLDTLKWTLMEHDGPAPASRLDFGMCAIRLKHSLVSQDDSEDVLASGKQAKDVLDHQIRMGSAGSIHSRGSSVGSAGSQRSLHSSGSITDIINADLPLSPNQLSPAHAPVDPAEVAAALELQQQAEVGPFKLVDLCLLVGGMDTQGEIFDDTMVIVTQEFQENTTENGACSQPPTEGACNS